MAVNFSESMTKENLMRAFAGESQARNRYTIAAERADKEGMYTIAEIFRYTADQERAHAERYYDLHEKRFGKLAQMLEDNTWYKGTEVRKWMCTNCGYIHEGNLAPELCPVCRHEKGYFLPYELACYKAETPGK